MPIATKSSKIDISEENKTKIIAKLFSDRIKNGDVLFFYGEIGVGKTTFIKYFINFLQEKNKAKVQEIPSPTFTLLNEYQIKELIIKHFDLYRIKKKEELNNLDIFEDISNQITLIEWPEILETQKPKNIYELYFEYDETLNNRFLSIYSSNNEKFINEIK